jgi:hypothetical protein
MLRAATLLIWGALGHPGLTSRAGRCTRRHSCRHTSATAATIRRPSVGFRVGRIKDGGGDGGEPVRIPPPVVIGPAEH